MAHIPVQQGVAASELRETREITGPSPDQRSKPSCLECGAPVTLLLGKA